MAVAKSYQALEMLSEPFMVSGRMYVRIRMKSGAEKQVRWYTDAEYARIYPGEKLPSQTKKSTQKEALGFQKGYVTIFKGDTYSHLDWFKASIARYTRFWGWYIVSTEEIPEDLPIDLIPLRLSWDQVGQENGQLKSEDVIAQVVELLIYDPGVSEYIGEIGDRLELQVTVTKSIPLEGAYGISTMHIMEDEAKNVFVWTTASKCWNVGEQQHIRGTVKKHATYHNTKQTILTRCTVVN